MVEQNVVRWPHLTARATRVGKSRVLLWKGDQSTSYNTLKYSWVVPLFLPDTILIPSERKKNPNPHPVATGITIFKNHNHLLPWQWNGMPIWPCQGFPSEKSFFVYYSPYPGMKWTSETRPFWGIAGLLTFHRQFPRGECWHPGYLRLNLELLLKSISSNIVYVSTMFASIAQEISSKYAVLKHLGWLMNSLSLSHTHTHKGTCLEVIWNQRLGQELTSLLWFMPQW